MIRSGFWCGARRAASMVASMLLVACTHHVVRPDTRPANRGDTSWHAVEQPDTLHYQLALGEVSSGATPLLQL